MKKLSNINKWYNALLIGAKYLSNASFDNLTAFSICKMAGAASCTCVHVYDMWAATAMLTEERKAVRCLLDKQYLLENIC